MLGRRRWGVRVLAFEVAVQAGVAEVILLRPQCPHLVDHLTGGPAGELVRMWICRHLGWTSARQWKAPRGSPGGQQEPAVPDTAAAVQGDFPGAGVHGRDVGVQG
jgi:hypothetical protein